MKQTEKGIGPCCYVMQRCQMCLFFFDMLSLFGTYSNGCFSFLTARSGPSINYLLRINKKSV